MHRYCLNRQLRGIVLRNNQSNGGLTVFWLTVLMTGVNLDVDDEGDLVAVRTDAELATMLASHDSSVPLRIYISQLIHHLSSFVAYASRPLCFTFVPCCTTFFSQILFLRQFPPAVILCVRCSTLQCEILALSLSAVNAFTYRLIYSDSLC